MLRRMVHHLPPPLRAGAEWLYRIATPRGVPRRLAGETFRVDARVRWMWDERREPELVRYYRERIGPGEVVLDVGSHAGVYALLAARLSSGSTVHAFEPNPTTRAVLDRHVAWNGLADRVRVNALAVSDRAGEATFFAAPLSGMSRLGSENPIQTTRSDRVTVATTTLDDYCARLAIAPTLLRIDVEGFEFAVLRGARATISRGRNRLRLVCELHPSAWSDAGDSARSGELLFEELGLRAVSLDGHANPLAQYGFVELTAE
jgi:FkbM family methyltransferase